MMGESIPVTCLRGLLLPPAGIALALCSPAQAGAPPAAIPSVRGEVLSGDTVALPDALKGKVGVLVLGFSQGARGEVADWGKRLAGDYGDSASVVYYEVPVLAAVPRMLRGWVVRKMAAEIPERAKGRFLPVYDHEAEWRVAAGYAKAEDAYVLVVDGAGQVRFRIEGEASNAAYAEVKRRAEEAR